MWLMLNELLNFGLHCTFFFFLQQKNWGDDLEMYLTEENVVFF